LLTIAESVASLLNTGPIVRPNWDPRNSKDLTLDIVLYQPFLDTRQGAPYILFQCASGRNWDEKLKEPDVDLWRKLLNPDFPTIRGVSLPFCLSDDGFHFASPKTSGFLLDRCRLLLAASKCSDWIATDLERQLIDWMTPRTNEILERSK
jgi:hypothetical protein